MIFSRTSFALRYYGVTRHFHKGSSKLHDQKIGEKLIMKVLNVAEKNDAAKSLAGLLSGGNLRRREGLSKWNKIYEFDYTLMGERCQMIMTSVSGHLLGLEFVGNFRNWQGCNPLALFDAPVMKQCSQDYEPIKRTLEKEARQCGILIIWTDCDREGENIGFEVIQVCTAVKHNLKIYRAKFSEITAQSARRAVQNLVQPDRRISDAVDVRQELDLRIGAAFTRFQTLRLQRVFPENLSNLIISYGSCQFPTMGFVVERYKAVQNFIPEPFWKIKVTHTISDLSVEFSWKRVRLFDQTACQVLYEICMERTLATVEKVQSKPKSKWRPLPLDTVELEKLASRKLKLSAKVTMQISEKLYTKGLISYPRTETNIFPKELNLRSLVEMHTADHNWGEFANRVLEAGPNPRMGKKSDQAHPPIHPTKYTGNLEGDERRVYEFIVRHFLACCSKDAEGLETVVDIDINEEKFVASGLMIIARNYLDVYPYDKWSGKEIHVYQHGQTFEPTNIEMTEGTTSAPNLLTEADLIALMEKHGIGTDATHADHIEKIKSRLYVGLENDNYFVPGQLGMGLVEGYDSMGFPMSKPNLRAELEADLKRVCEGTRNPAEVLREQLAKYKDVFRIAIEQAAKLDTALGQYLEEHAQPPGDNLVTLEETPEPAMKCPSCGLDMVLKTKRDGTSKYLSCMAYPQCRSALWFPRNVEGLTVSEESCPQCGPDVKKLNFKFRRGSMIPYCEDNYTGCVGGCDLQFLEMLDMRPLLSRPRPPGSPPVNRGGGITASFTDSGMGSSLGGGRSSASNTSHRGASYSSTRGRGSQASINRSSTDMGGWSITDNISSGASGRVPRLLGGGDESSDHENKVVCNCNLDAILLTVRKDGPNQGRKFYKCNKNQGQGCNFFMWADSVEENRQEGGRPLAAANNVPRQPPARQGGNIAGGSDDVLCRCEEPTKRLTVQKEGPNKGRTFYACAKGQNNGCNFFQWGDEVPPRDNNWSGGDNGMSGGRGGGTRRGGAGKSQRGAGRAGPSMDTEKKKRKCGVCGMEGKLIIMNCFQSVVGSL
uniref:DNA topoisomerase n=1 Tax=Timema poppense TaxID=170557 RepID=A0A7R9CG86_TIMPO|nr:unnamed protein product [Timema poppensis]